MPRRLLPLLAALCAGTPLAAAVYGLPEPPTPAPTPQFWFTFSDDFLGMAVLNTDDYRTANLGLGLAIERWRFAVDASMLTNRGTDGTTPSRSDELTYSLGYAVIDEEREGLIRPLLTLGLGGRTYGDMGGEEIQNRIHDTFGYKTLEIPYDPQQGTDGFAFYHGRLTLVPSWDYQGNGPFGRWAIQGESGGLASSGGEWQLYGAANLVSVGSDSMAWVGARYQWNGGDHPSPTSAIVAEQESGWWLVGGLSRTPGLVITASLNPDRETVAGTVGMTIDTAAVPMQGGAGYRVDESLKFTNSGSLGVDLRWQPAWLKEISLSPRDVLVLVYDFGGVDDPDEEWVDCNVGFDQLVLGWGPSWDLPVPFRRLAWSASAYAAAGVRLERIHEEVGTPRFEDDGIHAAGVLQGEIGTKLGWRFTDRGTSLIDRLRLGIGVDGWAPYPSVTARNGDDHEDYLVPGWSVHVTVGVGTEW